MKKIIKPKTQEEALYYSDFTGKVFEADCDAPVTLKIDCGYGSSHDGASLELHLSAEDLDKVLSFLKENLSEDFKKTIKKNLYELNKQYSEAVDFRDWSECDYILSNKSLLNKLM